MRNHLERPKVHRRRSVLDLESAKGKIGDPWLEGGLDVNGDE